MAEVDFGDFDAAEKWFAGQRTEVRCVMTSRAALRVAANLGRYDGDGAERLVLTALRSTLTSAVRGLGRTADVEWLTDAARSADSAALSAALSADSAALSADSAARSADSAARSARSAARFAARFADSAALSADSAARSAYSAALSADSAARSARSAASSAAYSAMQWDSLRIDGDLNAERLWAGAEVPPAIQSAHDDFLTQLRANPDWDFFRTWYEQMWEGTFTDWPLATKVAKIGDEVWKAGLADVAEAIRGIEARRAKKDAQIEPEPVPVSNVLPLFDRAPIVQASMTSMSEAITLRLDAFSSMARPNERIQFVETLRNMPETAQRIYDILEKGPSATNADTALAMEVGRLRAEVEQLKADLKAANADLADLRKKPWYKKASVLLLGSVVPAVGVALWTLSEEEFDGQSRWLNLAEELKFLGSKVWPEEDDRILEELKFKLPEIEDI